MPRIVYDLRVEHVLPRGLQTSPGYARPRPVETPGDKVRAEPLDPHH